MIDPKPIKKTADQLKKISNEFMSGFNTARASYRVLFEGMNDIRNTTIRKMISTKRDTSKKYLVTKPGKGAKYHNPSQPFYPPAISSGELKDSYMFDVDAFRGIYGSKKKYAFWLEKGTKHMQPRPVLKRSVRKHKRDIIKKLGMISKDLIVDIYMEVNLERLGGKR